MEQIVHGRNVLTSDDRRQTPLLAENLKKN